MPVLQSTTRKVRKSGNNPTIQNATTWPWFSSLSFTGATVSDETALSLTAFARGVSLIASACAGMPIHILQDKADGTKDRVKTEDTAYLWRRPNVEMTKQSFWERIFADEVRGNAFIWVEKDDIGQPAALWHLERGRVKVGRNSNRQKVYELDGEIPMIDYREGGEIVHIPNWGDSLVGYDVVKLATQAIALGLSAEEYAARTFGDGQIPAGIITTEQILDPAKADELSKRWEARHGGVSKAHKVAVLSAGAKFQQIARDPEKLQMEALRRFQVAEIARLLGIPPHLLADVERTTSWGSGIGEQGQAFITYTLNPHITRVKQAIDDALLVRELTDRFVEFDPGGLLRGSVLQQYQAHSIGWGKFLTTNEIRSDLNLPPIEGGDVLLAPVNMAPLTEIESMKVGQKPLE